METQTAVQVHARATATYGIRGLSQSIAIGALAVLTVSPLSSAHGSAVAADAQRLLGEYKCYICHADHRAKAGPAYDDVAAQFRGKRNAVPVIATEIRRGIRRGGPWHMPPHPEVSIAEARAMARYIMSLQPSSTPTAQR
jgi:cytochrome c